ncbi:MAG: hypothetical protein ABJF23_11745 [Bryobacteraceae bacterium]
MGSDLNTAEQDADGSFGNANVGGATLPCAGSGAAPPKVISPEKKHWVEIAMVDKEGNPLPGQDYEIKLPDGTTVTGSLDEKGTARVEGIDPGNCQIKFPSLDKTVWKRR